MGCTSHSFLKEYMVECSMEYGVMDFARTALYWRAFTLHVDKSGGMDALESYQCHLCW